MQPMTEDLWLQTAAEFECLWDLPHCVAAVDGLHVQNRAFAHCGSRDFNYKGFHSMILMALCDAKYRFVSVDFGASDRRGDANVFHFSAFGKRLRKSLLNIPPPCPSDGFKTDLPFFIVGDAAFSGNPQVISPFKGLNRVDAELIFNYRVSRARRVIENAFGILVARYRILNTMINGARALIKSVVLCCLALHNMHLLEEESIPPKRRKYRPDGYADYTRPDGTFVFGRWRNENPDIEQKLFEKLKDEVWVVHDLQHKKTLWNTEEVEEMFLEYFVHHPVPWQWRSAHIL